MRLPEKLSLMPGDRIACVAGRHEPIPGGLTVAIQATDTRETGNPDPFRRK
jgi:hypothetical protein